MITPLAADCTPDSPAVGVVAPDLAGRRRLTRALRGAQLHVVATGARADELSPGKLDVVVLQSADSRAASELRTLAPRCAQAGIVCVVQAPSWKTVRGLLRDGATAVVDEEHVGSALALAVMGASAGQLSLPSRLRSEIARPVLSVREKQVLAMVVMGCSNLEMSQKLYLAESTVKSHLSSAFAKLGVRSRNEATALILDPESGLGAGILTIQTDESEPHETAGVASSEGMAAAEGRREAPSPNG